MTMSCESLREYVGNLHIHSLYSDGGGSVAQIAEVAGRLGLDFIILNDHDAMTDDLHLEEEGVKGPLLVLMGLEIGERYHHYLAYDLKKMIGGRGLGPQEVIDRVNEQGGFGFLAHPFEKGMPFSEGSIAYTWNDTSVTGFKGICIWNFTSRWKERVKTPFHGLFFLLFKALTLKGPSRKTLAFWDEVCQSRRVVAIGGSDAHGSRFRWGRVSFKPLSYDDLLMSITIHILLERELPKDTVGAKQAIYEAMKEGRLYISHERLAMAKGFRFGYESDKGIHLIMGQEGEFHPGRLKVTVPRPGRIRVLKDGRVQKTYRGTEAVHPVKGRGVYRIEVYGWHFPFGWRPWIFSNPIYLR